MKYFTRELMERYGSENDAVAAAADAEWEAVLERAALAGAAVNGRLGGGEEVGMVLDPAPNV